MILARLEELLRTRPPDEPDYLGEPLVGPRLVRAAPSGARARMTSPGAAAVGFGGALIGLLLFGLVTGPLAGPTTNPPSGQTADALASATSASARPSASASSSDVIPWIDESPAPPPTPEPTPDPASYQRCVADDLILVAGGWNGATGSLAGGASVINASNEPCAIGGKPGVDLFDSAARLIARGQNPTSPEPADLVPLPTGGTASVITVWSGWCGEPPARPLHLRLRLPDDKTELTARVDEAGGSETAVPRCDSPGSDSSFGVPLPFEAPEQVPPDYPPEDCAVDRLQGFLGTWGAAAGTSYASMFILNRDRVDCALGIEPRIEILDFFGHVLVNDEPASSAAPGSTLALPAGSVAVGSLGFADWCSAAPASPLAANVVIDGIRLPLELRSDIPVPPCMEAPGTSSPPGLFYDRSLAIPGGELAPEEPNSMNGLPVRVSIEIPASVAPGTDQDYIVDLLNVSQFGKPINLFPPCPSYTESLTLPGTTRDVPTTYQLNCGQSVVLEPGAPVRFAMRIAIPPDSAAGTASLVWQLGARGPSGKTAFVIAP